MTFLLKKFLSVTQIVHIEEKKFKQEVTINAKRHCL